MNNFEKGDILRGEKIEFEESYHYIVYISGPIEAPLAVVLTHSPTEKKSCNIKLTGIYDNKDTRPQYFVGHLIQKMSEWGPYHKYGKLIEEDLKTIEDALPAKGSLTWAEYLDYSKGECPDHKNI